MSSDVKERIEHYFTEGNKNFQNFKFQESKRSFQNALNVYGLYGSPENGGPQIDAELTRTLVEINRKLAMSSLYLEKWEQEGSNLKLDHFEESVQAFKISLQWSSKLDKTIHDENVQVWFKNNIDNRRLWI